jgi:hypothetical protein
MDSKPERRRRSQHRRYPMNRSGYLFDKMMISKIAIKEVLLDYWAELGMYKGVISVELTVRSSRVDEGK